MPDTQEIENLLTSLGTAEYWIRKYRTRAAVRDLEGDGRRAMDCHRQAAEERARADAVSAQLARLLGPDDGPGWQAVEYLKLAWRQEDLLARIRDEETSFEDACFARRHPRWAAASERHRAALARWQGTTELDGMAPHYLPIYPGWVD